PPERDSRLVRTVRVVDGSVTLRMRCAVRHDYARADTRATRVEHDVRFDAPHQPSLRLAAQVPMTIEDDAACATFVLTKGQSVQFVLGGLDDELVQQAVAQLKGTEFARAREIWERKYGTLPKDAAERGRQMRFLASRGFEGEVIRRVLVGAVDEDQ
ncbi:MAG: regulatory protein RecX, partial [Burkholderiales bacterium]